MGEQPWWYRLLRAADRLHVPVWELLDVSEFWITAALAAQEAEVAAQNKREKKSRKGLKGGHTGR